jgi:Recombination endonuclease VII
MSKSSDKYIDPLYHRGYYEKNKERILKYRKTPEQLAKAKAWRDANPEKVRENWRRWQANNRNKIKAYGDARRKSDEYKSTRPLVERKNLLRKYGLTLETFDAMLAAQGGCCAICGSDKPYGKGRFHVDHCHDTGVVRGILCHPCNTSIGTLGDNPERLEKAAAYLRKNSHGTRPAQSPQSKLG